MPFVELEPVIIKYMTVIGVLLDEHGNKHYSYLGYV